MAVIFSQPHKLPTNQNVTLYLSTNQNVIKPHPRGDGHEISWTKRLLSGQRVSEACVSRKSCSACCCRFCLLRFSCSHSLLVLPSRSSSSRAPIVLSVFSRASITIVIFSCSPRDHIPFVLTLPSRLFSSRDRSLLVLLSCSPDD